MTTTRSRDQVGDLWGSSGLSGHLVTHMALSCCAIWFPSPPHVINRLEGKRGATANRTLKPQPCDDWCLSGKGGSTKKKQQPEEWEEKDVAAAWIWQWWSLFTLDMLSSLMLCSLRLPCGHQTPAQLFTGQAQISLLNCVPDCLVDADSACPKRNCLHSLTNLDHTLSSPSQT